jgi:hypothetical protein
MFELYHILTWTCRENLNNEPGVRRSLFYVKYNKTSYK